jgi:hypothetical protein
MQSLFCEIQTKVSYGGEIEEDKIGKQAVTDIYLGVFGNIWDGFRSQARTFCSSW